MKYLLLSFIIISFIHSANAQWNSDTAVRNIICGATNQQADQRICSDGNQGAYIAWDDYRTTPSRVCMQHIDSGGYTKWQINGETINDTTNIWGSTNPEIAPDGKGGVFITWNLTYSSLTYILAQHLNSAGVPLWKKILKVDTVNDARAPKLTADGHGGVIMNWYAYIPGYDDIYMQWLDSTGRARFAGQAGLRESSPVYGAAHYSSFVATDNSYNAYITFADDDTLRVLKIDTSGNFVWGQKGKVLTTTFVSYSTNFEITADGNKGVIVGWDDHRRTPLTADLYAQRINPGGTFLWGATGALVDSSSAIYSHAYISPATDGNGGVFICFGYGHLFMQHLSGNGSRWNLTKTVTTNTSGENYPSIAADGHNDAIVSWDDGRGVYAMRFDTSGNYLWRPSAIPVKGTYFGGSASGTVIIALNNGNAIAAMAFQSDIYASRFTDLSSIATGVKEINNTSRTWSVFPNPANGVVYLKNISGLSTKAVVQLYNSVGQLISSENMDLSSSNQQAIQVGTTQGIYFLKVTSDNSVNTYSIIVQ